MSSYRVHWEIDVDDAPTAVAAARQALDAILRPGSIAHVFDVEAGDERTLVDLDAEDQPRPSTEVRFTIRETTYYTGHVQIDAARWHEHTGLPLSSATVDEDTLRDYLDHCGGEVAETNGDIDGQTWIDFEVVHH